MPIIDFFRNLFFAQSVAQLPPAWNAPLHFKSKLTLEDVKFIFEQAEKLLIDSVNTSETIVRRTNTLLTLITGTLFALAGYIITRIGRSSVFDPALFSAIVGACFLYVLAIACFRNLYPKDYLLPGTVPKDLFNPAFFNGSIEDKNRILRYYVNEVENYMYRIEINNEINSRRWSRYSQISRLLLCLPPILLVCYFFTNL